MQNNIEQGFVENMGQALSLDLQRLSALVTESLARPAAGSN
jgi:hypothetical protein